MGTKQPTPEAPPRWWWGRHGTPPWWHLALTTGVALILLDASSKPYGLSNPLPWLVVLLSGFALGLAWLIGAAAPSDTHEPPPVKQRLHRTRWLLLPTAALLVLLALGSELPFRVRYRLSEKTLGAVAARVLAGESISTPCWIGLYRISHINTNDSPGMVNFVTGSSISDPVGFACTTTGCNVEEW